ncbi:DUF202 domain-containing protein [Nocardia sp. NEAU-G5]|uniref:DUF202 domain-containing protein n=1 Tax=Nocardia albiluteola TaxID=2842303 RepID=A0ABS6ATQ1_9NOCA|nr:DUF202 domain-containing protein [Nocardia albiluteola]MBU3061412.1 DUF202 domain-containing protein [Nocardia albiluteola]
MTAPAPDTGMARERTALSWRRTAVSAMGTAALFINHAVSNGWRHAAAAPLAAAVVLGVLALMCFERNRLLREGQDAHSRRAVTVTTVVIVLVCAVALYIGLRDPLR